MASQKTLLTRLEALGHWFFYLALRLFGYMGGVVLLVPVISVYVLCSRKIHRTVRPYMVHRFAETDRTWLWWHTFKNVLSFGQVLVDRAYLGVRKDAALQSDFCGYNNLVELVNQGRGVILVTGHVGNWQSALARLGNLPVKVHALMQYDQLAAAKHFFDLHGGERPFEIIDADGDFGGMIEAVAALNRGELVTIMGDRYIKGSSSTVNFLGEPVRLPDGAYMLAASAKAPVAVLFAAKTGLKSYEMKLWDVIYPRHTDRDKRATMLQECTEKYIRALEDYLQQYPYQWYNFYNFWEQ